MLVHKSIKISDELCNSPESIAASLTLCISNTTAGMANGVGDTLGDRDLRWMEQKTKTRASTVRAASYDCWIRLLLVL